MALVQYSDSDSEADINHSSLLPSRPTKRPRHNPSSLPPLPPTFHDLYASSSRVSVKDDPSLHGGRKRVIPHIEGNWPTHIYLEWYPVKKELAILQDVLAQCELTSGEKNHNKTRLNSLLYSDLGAQLPLHISLSRPVVLRTEQRSSFTETLRSALHDSHIPPFHVKLGNLHWVSNYEKTRWFLVLSVKKPVHDNLNRLLRISNRALALFGQPPLYETRSSVAKTSHRTKATTRQRQNSRRDNHNNATAEGLEDYSHCFHISLAWTLTEPTAEDNERIARVDLRLLEDLIIPFKHVKVKIGNSVSSMSLSEEIIENETGLGGL